VKCLQTGKKIPAKALTELDFIGTQAKPGSRNTTYLSGGHARQKGVGCVSEDNSTVLTGFQSGQYMVVE